MALMAQVSLISLELNNSGTGLATHVFESVGDISSLTCHRVTSAAAALSIVQANNASLLITEITAPDDAVQLIVAMKLLKPQIDLGLVRVIVLNHLASPTLEQKLRTYGCTEI